MGSFIHGMELCEGFFHDCAGPVLAAYFPDLTYSAGLIGYGSDVLGYDDAVSTDHMWGPRFYLFLREEDMVQREAVLRALAEHLPYTYRGYSVNFTEPDWSDCGVRRPAPIASGPVNPLVFVQTFDSYLTEQLGTSDLDRIGPFQWLACSEHRLLSLVSGKFFVDGLNCAGRLSKIKYYPEDVKLYLIASNWEAIASEQAFLKRCGGCGDAIGSQIICARLAERLMRLCFLYRDTYAPYSKWFGTAFGRLEIDRRIQQRIGCALSAVSLEERERAIVDAQVLVADLHNESRLTEPVAYQVERYFGREIEVIFADKFAEAAAKRLADTAFTDVPLIGSFSQLGGLSSFADEPKWYGRISGFYGR